MYLRALSAVALAFAIGGCTAAELNRADPPIEEPPCNAQSPYLCPDGNSCCHSWDPVCWGPDSAGYYCEPAAIDPDDPTHMYSSAPRHRPTPRVDLR